ncbi:MAG: DUF2959 family protein [Balneolaceae bacterium]
MKARILSLSLLLIFLVYGCGSSGNSAEGLERSDNAVESMETVYENLKETRSSIEGVESSLRELTRSGQSDIKSVFEVYSENVSKLEEQGNQLLENKSEMEKNVDNYFAAWENGAEYENQRLQELSRERRNELKEMYNQVNDSGNGVEEDLNNFISDTKEIREYLSNDLTSAGISAVDSLTTDIMYDSENLKSSLTKMQSALDVALSEMARRGN